jgi:hypothetical protein
MATRDPEVSARNRVIKDLKLQYKSLLPTVLHETGIESESSLHGIIGHKNEYFIDVRNAIIYSGEEYVSMWLTGLLEHIKKMPQSKRNGDDAYYRIYLYIKDYKSFQDYLYLFLKRTFLNNYEAYTKAKPKIEESEIWIGQNNASYGILITPRFNGTNWENDKSEIRHFDKKYWTVGHILKTGLQIPNSNETLPFETAKSYLDFFVNVIVRNSGSEHELKIAKKYREFVLNHSKPEDIPLLIPEYRYDGLLRNHKHRLDFTIIESHDFNKFGFELSPWSTHGLLTGTKGKTQEVINDEARINFENEILKMRKFFKKFGIYTLIYSDSDLKNIDSVFDDMKKYLEPKTIEKQMKFHIFEDILSTEL